MRALPYDFVVDYDEDGEEVSTLIVNEIADADAAALKSEPKAKKVPASLNLLMTVLKNALIDHGMLCRPLADGPEVRAVAERHVRIGYFKGIADKAEPDEDAAKLYDRKGFKNAAETALKSQALFAAEHQGERTVAISQEDALAALE